MIAVIVAVIAFIASFQLCGGVSMSDQPTSPAVLIVDEMRLREHVNKLSVLRHGVDNYDELERSANYVERQLVSSGLQVKNQYFHFKKRKYRNIIATVLGSRPDLPPLLIGAHYDGNRNTPGADDNASGVAVLLETARLIAQTKPVRTVEFVAFTLEEPQTFTHIIRRGSRFFTRQARKKGLQYHGALILECVGFTAKKQKGYLLSKIVRIDLPREGDFLAVIGNGPSKAFMESCLKVAGRNVPSLKTLGYAAPLQGYLLPQARFSDHSSFWERDYPAIMLNDTVMFRNPNYHKADDVPATLNFQFMTDVAKAVVAFANAESAAYN